MTKNYVGTKIVTAWPQTRSTADGLSVIEEDGYAVKYEDGYVSWSPKAVFESAYLEIGNTSGLLPHQIRVVAEYATTKDRAEKLKAFLGTDLFAGLEDIHEKERLARQYGILNELVEVLAERIEAFKSQSDACGEDEAADIESDETSLPLPGAEGSFGDQVHAENYEKVVQEHFPETTMAIVSAEKSNAESLEEAEAQGDPLVDAVAAARARHVANIPKLLEQLDQTCRNIFGQPLDNICEDIEKDLQERYDELYPIALAYQEAKIAEIFGVDLWAYLTANEVQRSNLLKAAQSLFEILPDLELAMRIKNDSKVDAGIHTVPAFGDLTAAIENQGQVGRVRAINHQRILRIALDPNDPDPMQTAAVFVDQVRNGTLEVLEITLIESKPAG